MADSSDYMRAGLFIVSFIVLGLWKLPHWLMAETIAIVFSGVGIYFRPEVTIALQTKDLKMDIVHLQLNRLFAACLLGSAVTWFASRRASDSNVISALLWSRVMGVGCLLFIVGIGHMHYHKLFTDKHLWFGVLGNFLWWLANLVQLIKTRPALMEPCQSRAITLVSHINLLVILLISLGYMAYPSMMASVTGHKLDGYHLHTSRAVGGLLMGFAILAWFTPRFRALRDVRMVFLGQIVAGLLMVGSLVALKFSSKSVKKTDMWLWVSIFLPLIVVPLVGITVSMTDMAQKENINTKPSGEENRENEDSEDKKQR